MRKCKACGAEIIWKKTGKGKSMPCNPEQVIYYAKRGAKGKIITPNGEVISCNLKPPYDGAEPTGVGFIPHWATCLKAEQFRK